MADSVAPSDIDAVLTNPSWAIFSTYHMVLKASSGATIFGRDMMFDIPFIADWKQIGDYRQRQTDQIQSMKIQNALIMITQLVVKY
jgi:hypothetical protein